MPTALTSSSLPLRSPSYDNEKCHQPLSNAPEGQNLLQLEPPCLWRIDKIQKFLLHGNKCSDTIRTFKGTSQSLGDRGGWGLGWEIRGLWAGKEVEWHLEYWAENSSPGETWKRGRRRRRKAGVMGNYLFQAEGRDEKMQQPEPACHIKGPRSTVVPKCHVQRWGVGAATVAATRLQNTLFTAQGQASIILYGEVVIHLSLSLLGSLLNTCHYMWSQQLIDCCIC